MKLKWMCLLFLSLLLSPPLLWGQNHSIKGQIVDAKSNEPLIGVNITVEGTSNGLYAEIANDAMNGILTETEKQSPDQLPLCFCYMMDLLGILTEKMPRAYFYQNPDSTKS